MTPQSRDAVRLQQILSEFYAGRTSRDEARSAVIDVVLARLLCARVSLWKFAGDGDGFSLLCFAAKQANGPLDEGLAAERAAMGAIMGSPNQREAAATGLEKREPRFT